VPDDKAILAKHDPELLQWFEDMAKHPYETVAAHNKAEAARQSLMSIPYGEAEHKLNVFRGDNLTAQGDFTKRDPALAEFYQREAQDVSIPIFGKNRNMTIANRLTKEPPVAGLVSLAERIHEQWQAADKSTALEQRAAAEEALKKLAAAAA
jgi:hypothetical protein